MISDQDAADAIRQAMLDERRRILRIVLAEQKAVALILDGGSAERACERIIDKIGRVA